MTKEGGGGRREEEGEETDGERERVGETVRRWGSDGVLRAEERRGTRGPRGNGK